MKRRQSTPSSTIQVTARIESLASDGRGVARIDGLAVFVVGALPGELVTLRYSANKKNFGEGDVCEIIEPSPDRVVPRCEHFGLCGGCSLQHLRADAQIFEKQRGLTDALQHIGKVEPEIVLAPLVNDHWGYRYKARLGVKYVRKKERLMIGFREKESALLADLSRCEVLHPAVGERFEALRALILGLSIYQQLPQIEVAIGDDVVALIFRNLAAFSDTDLDALRQFGAQHTMQIFIQPKGPDTVTRIYPDEGKPLSYALPDFEVNLEFLPSDFTQVNPGLNRRLVKQAIELLAPQPDERVLDLFCGIGNFTLALSRRAGHVVGVEGEKGLVERARANAERNGVKNAEFYVANLAEEFEGAAWARQQYDKLLIDPPRSGAFEIVQKMKHFKPKRIVYVSCNPATLARDAGELVHNQGYRLRSAGVMDMFPHTTHVESIAVFELKGSPRA